MIARPLTSLLIACGTLLSTSVVHAQGLFGWPRMPPNSSQPRYVSPCGPAGCPTTMNSGYASSGYCSNGNCGSTMYYAPRGNGMSTGTCGTCGCSTGTCANGACRANCVNGNCGVKTLPYGNGYPSQTVPMPAARSRDYNTSRPAYYYDELPARVTPPSYRTPRHDYFYGANRSNRFETTSVDRPQTRFETDRSPFYP